MWTGETRRCRACTSTVERTLNRSLHITLSPIHLFTLSPLHLVTPSPRNLRNVLLGQGLHPVHALLDRAAAPEHSTPTPSAPTAAMGADGRGLPLLACAAMTADTGSRLHSMGQRA